jgi:CRISPR-associated protein Csb2
MPGYLCVSVTFLDPISAFHGRRDAGKPEWPPSPLRIFQAMVAAATSHWRQRFQNCAKPTFEWLQKQEPPLIIAPQSDVSVAIPIAVPNNDMDIPASFWAKFREPPRNKTPQSLKTMKMIRTTRVYYIWHLTNNSEFEKYKDILFAAVGCITHVGWGVDMVAAQASVISEKDIDGFPGERWFPDTIGPEEGLRMPRDGTLDALIQRYGTYLNRIGLDGFNQTPPLPVSAFDKVGYRRATDPLPREVAAFSLLRPDASRFCAFDTKQKALTVAGMMRHATRLAADNAGWSKSDINAFILGHSESQNCEEHVPVGPQRFAYLPLPSIEARNEGRARVVGSVRRVLITTFAGADSIRSGTGR